MNKMILAALAVFTVSTSIAQTTIAPAAQATEQRGGVKEEIRAASGQLKEAYSSVSQQFALLSKEIGPDATKATAEQAAEQNTLKASLIELESMLTAVNTATEANWQDVKAKADVARTSALKLVAARKEAAK